ncbi:toxin-antitoxin system HicB family antitoxin [Intestinibacter bartlettii]
MAEKTMTIRLDEDLHKKIKLKSVQENKSIKNYILGLVLKDLEEDKKDSN